MNIISYLVYERITPKLASSIIFVSSARQGNSTGTNSPSLPLQALIEMLSVF